MAGAEGGNASSFDELGELPLELQPKLRAHSAKGEIRRIAGTAREAVGDSSHRPATKTATCGRQ